MKVVCDNCRAVYKVPDDKLTKAVNKATCRNCGHRMLIPRPKPNADPEERTLVTAVAPTPVGAPPRTGAVQPPADDVRMGTPLSQDRSDAPSNTPPSAEEFEGPDTKIAVNPSEQVTARESQRNAARSLPPTSTQPPARLPPKRATPAPPPPSGNTGSRRTPPPRTPAPLPARAAGPRPAMYDPANDLNWAMLGMFGALIGGFLLAFLSVWNTGPVGALVMWFGLALTFGGGVLTFMILLTGGRGRRPAQTLLSVILGFVVAVVMSSTMVATKWGAERVIDVMDIHFSNVGLTAGTSVPAATPSVGVAAATPSVAAIGTAPAAPAAVTPASAPAAAPAAPPAAPGRPPAQVAEAAPAKAPPAPARPAPPPPAPPRPAPSAPTSRTTPPPAPPPPPPAPKAVDTIEPDDEFDAPAPAPAPAPKPEGLATVPMEVIHVMLSNNLEVKKCFVPLFKAGTLPPRVDLKFNIMPSGNATNGQILQGDFKGSELEGCLVRAVSGITFPPTSGTGTSITYPFVLQ